MGNAKAINFVGSFHEDGWVVTRDVDKAADCYARAAEGGDFRGCFNHARMLGLAGKVDEALVWLARAGETATASFLDKAEAWLRRSDVRSEEHTSELQSLMRISYAVFCLKKK